MKVKLNHITIWQKSRSQTPHNQGIKKCFNKSSNNAIILFEAYLQGRLWVTATERSWAMESALLLPRSHRRPKAVMKLPVSLGQETTLVACFRVGEETIICKKEYFPTYITIINNDYMYQWLIFQQLSFIIYLAESILEIK